MIAGPAIMALGSGLLYSVKVTDSKSYPMGYSALIGFGCGMVLQNVIVRFFVRSYLPLPFSLT